MLIFRYSNTPLKYIPKSSDGDEDWVIVCSPAEKTVAQELAEKLSVCDYSCFPYSVPDKLVFVTYHA